MNFKFMTTRIGRYLFDTEVKVRRAAAKVKDAVGRYLTFSEGSNP